MADTPNEILSAMLDMVEAAKAARRQETREVAGQRLFSYRPSLKQARFHAMGAHYPERLFAAGNQLGKTLAGASEVAMHLTGLYPDWWQGKRFHRATRWWTAGVTNLSTRDAPQKLLVGEPMDEDQWGTGTIPRECIVNVTRSRNLANAVDTMIVRHVTGGRSMLGFKSYEMGRRKWQAETLDGVWFDEEPPHEIYIEGRTRTNEAGHFTMLTFTPLEGMTETVKDFFDHADRPWPIDLTA